MQPTDGGVTVLLGGTNSQISPQFYYALGLLQILKNFKASFISKY